MGYLTKPIIQLDDLLDLDTTLEIQQEKPEDGSKSCCNGNCDC